MSSLTDEQLAVRQWASADGRVYVVKADSGCYEDRHEWIVGIYTDIDEARKVAEEEQTEDDSQYDSVYTSIETWTTVDGSGQIMRHLWTARWSHDRPEQSNSHMIEVDSSVRVEDLDESYPMWVDRGGRTKEEAESRLAEAMSARSLKPA